MVKQIIVYEYVPNGSVSIHLMMSRAGQVTKEKHEFKHRLSIALGATKGDPLSIFGFPGLAHLQSFKPWLTHNHFKTTNVLVIENFIAKVGDAGVRDFLSRVESAGPSSQVTAYEMFLSPE
ncbi:hypothetical protein L1887_18363 [Cichorium endivia]|nr:hypothetical protein L1887_18363 [Cichorium endivia]